MPQGPDDLAAFAQRVEIEALMAGYDLPSLADLLDRPAWHADALCREYPDVDWFPGRGQSLAPARAVCARCAVHDECRAYALEDRDATGVWGGLSQQKRGELRRPAAA